MKKSVVVSFLSQMLTRACMLLLLHQPRSEADTYLDNFFACSLVTGKLGGGKLGDELVTTA